MRPDKANDFAARALAPTLLLLGADARRTAVFLTFTFADHNRDRWLDISHWDDLGPERHAWQGAQLWTKNSIYELDHELRCVAVFDRQRGDQQEGHPMVGQHLSGGFGHGETIVVDEMPTIGQAAVFSPLRARPATLRRTSRIERIRVRMRPAPVERLSEERLSQPFGGMYPVPETA